MFLRSGLCAWGYDGAFEPCEYFSWLCTPVSSEPIYIKLFMNALANNWSSWPSSSALIVQEMLLVATVSRCVETWPSLSHFCRATVVRGSPRFFDLQLYCPLILLHYLTHPVLKNIDRTCVWFPLFALLVLPSTITSFLTESTSTAESAPSVWKEP